jgi:hypothetical protein
MIPDVRMDIKMKDIESKNSKEESAPESISLDGPAEPGGFTVQASFLQRVNGVPDEAFKFLYCSFPCRNRWVVARPLP